MSQDAALQRLIEQVKDAAAQSCPLDICGGQTKSFLGGVRQGEPLHLRPIDGISSYEPTELVITARAGTLWSELEAAVAQCGQYLPFDPPQFGAQSTIGGVVAAGLSGPARPVVGALRDYILGMSVLDGRGHVLSFGGQVMKNVAGYDVSRLLAGSMGVLGVILEISLKVLPVPKAVCSVVHNVDEVEALRLIDSWRCRPLPIHATAWHAGQLRVRLAGGRAAVEQATKVLGGVVVGAADEADWWARVRDHRHPFWLLENPLPLWRLSLPAGVAPLETEAESFIEWGGCQRWLRTATEAASVHAMARQAGGHAVRWRGGGRVSERVAPMDETLLRLHRRLKQAFDPYAIFNLGRLHPDL